MNGLMVMKKASAQVGSRMGLAGAAALMGAASLYLADNSAEQAYYKKPPKKPKVRQTDPNSRSFEYKGRTIKVSRMTKTRFKAYVERTRFYSRIDVVGTFSSFESGMSAAIMAIESKAKW